MPLARLPVLPSLLALVLVAACGGGSSTPAPGALVPAPLAGDPATFVHWENLSVHPVDLAPDGRTLCVCNTPDHRLEVFDVAAAVPRHLGSVPVGLDPVSVRVRTGGEAWVVNHVSDTVSVVDLATLAVIDTLDTLDEPADVVFAGLPARAYVSCSQANALLVFDPADLAAPPATIPIAREDPRALAVSEDGRSVYVAIFESGNGTTVLGGGLDPNAVLGAGFPPNVVSDPAGPHGGTNPPPNGPGGTFEPAQRPGNPPPPPVGLVVRRDAGGRWRDDTGADWTGFVSGAQAARSGRVPGWDVLDEDLAVVDTGTHAVRYVARGLNVCTALAVQPGAGRVTVVGTDATNEVRYEPNVRGRFLRVLASSVDPTAGTATLSDLNPHLAGAGPSVPAPERVRALGDPRGIAWNATGTRAYVTGLGSGNVAVLGVDLERIARVDVGRGPTGIALSPDGARAFVLNRFEGSLSVVDTTALAETARVPLFDPTPEVVQRGRRHLYDTHATSGTGAVACASCHVDARMDRLAWDLGDPAGPVEALDQNCLTDLVVPCEDFHPMKGPMLTQTLQDIVGKEPFHWRGDRAGLEEFNGAFRSLLGADEGLTDAEMQEFEDFLATIRFPPNPFRGRDNALPRTLALDGHFAPGRFGSAGEPLPPGDAQRGLALYRTANLDGGVPGFQCVTCHTLPTGIGPDVVLGPGGPAPAPVGPNGERHHSLVSVDGSTNVSLKIPQLRNLYDRVGFETTHAESRAGFGFLHDGSVDSLARFVAEPVFNVGSRQDVADLVAFLLAFSGSDLPAGSPGTLTELPGPASRDTHAAVGWQTTLGARRDEARLDAMRALADGAPDVLALVAKGGGAGWLYDPTNARFLTDRNGESVGVAALRAQAAPGRPITFTLVPAGMGRRLGIDRDDDGFGDGTEEEWGTDPANPQDKPG